MQAEQGVIVLGDFARKVVPDKKIRLPEASFLVGYLEDILHGLVHGGGLVRISGIFVRHSLFIITLYCIFSARRTSRTEPILPFLYEK